MIQTTISISKQAVYEEVAKTTAYNGAKQIEADAGAYDRLLATDEDRQMLERFWVEACDAATIQLKRFAKSVNEQTIGDGSEDTAYTAVLSMPPLWPSSLSPAVNSELLAFFVALITAKWFTIAGSDKAETYASLADTKLTNTTRLLYHRSKPTYTSPI